MESCPGLSGTWRRLSPYTPYTASKGLTGLTGSSLAQIASWAPQDPGVAANLVRKLWQLTRRRMRQHEIYCTTLVFFLYFDGKNTGPNTPRRSNTVISHSHARWPFSNLPRIKTLHGPAVEPAWTCTGCRSYKDSGL